MNDTVEFENILELLKKNELIFHHPAADMTENDIDNLIDDEFCEIGASGRMYSREDAVNTLIDRLKKGSFEDNAWETKDFEYHEIAPNTYLLIYVLIQSSNRVTYRSTIWRYYAPRWKAVYHQGTMIQE